MSASRLFRSASVSLVMTFTLGVAVGFSLCYALMVVVGADRSADGTAVGASPEALAPSAAPSAKTPTESVTATPEVPKPAVAPPAPPPPAPAPTSSPAPPTQEEMKQLWPARQLFVTLPAGPIDPAWVALLKTYSPGGVLVTASDSGQSTDVAATIRQAKEAVGAGGGQSDLPLAVIGQEGGANNPLGLSPAPSPRELGESGGEKHLRETALRYAAAARAAGAAAVLGPRLDLATAMNEDSNLCFGASSDQVSACGIAFARAMAEGGVLPIMMHYPGTGTAVRTASGPPIVAETNLEALTDIMLPFANAAAEQLPGILVGCATVPTLDKAQTGRPACASPVMVQGILRDKWAYQGVVLADVTQPALASPVAIDLFVTNCLAAGCDAVLLGPVTTAEFEQICRTLTVALRDGALNTDRMAAARARLASWSLALKMETPASEKKPPEPVAPPITDAAPAAPQPTPAPITDAAQPAPPSAESPANKPTPRTGVVEHAIAPGETLDGIAKKYGVSVADIVKQNNLKNNNSIQAGAKLKIETPTAAETPKPAPAPAPEPPATVIQEAAPAPETPPVAPEAPTEAPKAEKESETATPQPAPAPAEKSDESKTESLPTAAPLNNAAAPESKVEPAPEPKPEPEKQPVEAPAPAPPAAVPEVAAPTPAPVPETAPAAPAPTEPTPEAANAAAPEDEGQYEYHVVQPGENLYRLAISSGTTKEELIRLNDIKDPALVKMGQKLKIPKKKP